MGTRFGSGYRSTHGGARRNSLFGWLGRPLTDTAVWELHATVTNASELCSHSGELYLSTGFNAAGDIRRLSDNWASAYVNIPGQWTMRTPFLWSYGGDLLFHCLPTTSGRVYRVTGAGTYAVEGPVETGDKGWRANASYLFWNDWRRDGTANWTQTGPPAPNESGGVYTRDNLAGLAYTNDKYWTGTGSTLTNATMSGTTLPDLNQLSTYNGYAYGCNNSILYRTNNLANGFTALSTAGNLGWYAAPLFGACIVRNGIVYCLGSQKENSGDAYSQMVIFEYNIATDTWARTHAYVIGSVPVLIGWFEWHANYMWLVANGKVWRKAVS